MKKITYIVSSMALGALMAGCADYVDTSDFKVDKPESIQANEYLDTYDLLNTHIDRAAHPNFKLGVALSGTDYATRSGLYTLAASNFDMVMPYTEMMYGSVVSNNGSMIFDPVRKIADAAAMSEQQVLGHALTSGSYQNVTWLRTILANAVANLGEDQKIIDSQADYSSLAEFPYPLIKSFAPVVKDGVLTASLANKKTFYLTYSEDISPAFDYEFVFSIKASKNVSLTLRFGDLTQKISVNTSWQEFNLTMSVEGEEVLGLILDPGPQKVDVEVSAAVMKHQRALTEAEKTECYQTEMDNWISGLMAAAAGNVKTWNLVNDALADSGDDGTGHYPLKEAPAGSKTEFYWQDCFGSTQFAKMAYDIANTYYSQFGGEGALKYYVNESCLDDAKKAESLVYWVSKWENAGAKIDGIGTKIHVVCNEDKDADAEVKAKITKNLEILAAAGKEVLISELEVNYVDADGKKVAAADLTDDQQRTLGAFYVWIIDTYFAKVPANNQAGIILWAIAEDGNQTALWSKEYKRRPIYAIIADALKSK